MVSLSVNISPASTSLQEPITVADYKVIVVLGNTHKGPHAELPCFLPHKNMLGNAHKAAFAVMLTLPPLTRCPLPCPLAHSSSHLLTAAPSQLQHSGLTLCWGPNTAAAWSCRWRCCCCHHSAAASAPQLLLLLLLDLSMLLQAGASHQVLLLLLGCALMPC